jgi:cell division protein FtsI (penicillin-binding protein 3)
MDPVDHHRLLTAFGMGQKTGLDLPGESAGILHPPKNWDDVTHTTIGFGYGLAATPVQMASAVAAIANDGVWVTPHIIQESAQVVTRRVLSSETAQNVTRLLTASIEAGKKNSLVYLPHVRLAGKTGTSRKMREDGKGYSSDVFTSFVGYFPAENPKALVMVVVDSPSAGNAWGATVAGPIFKQIAQQTAGYLGI